MSDCHSLIKIITLTFLFSLTTACGSDSDNSNSSSNAEVNLPPSADAGNNQTHNLSSSGTISLSGQATTDPNTNDTLNYQWSVADSPSGSTHGFGTANSDSTTFIADTAGSYVIELLVTDSGGLNDTDVAIITYIDNSNGGAINQAPIADADDDVTIKIDQEFYLNGNYSSDPNDSNLTYLWTLISAPSGASATINTPNNSVTSFSVSAGGPYVFELTVTNEEGVSDTDQVLVNIEANLPPVANAGDDISTTISDSFGTALAYLHGSGSYDPNTGDYLNYSWTLVSSPDNSDTYINSLYSSNPVAELNTAGEYLFELTVVDETGLSDTDHVTVTVDPGTPIVAVTGPQHGYIGDTITLTGYAENYPESSEALTYEWSLVATPDGSAVSLEVTDAAEISFKADIEGSYDLKLTISAGDQDSDAFNLTIGVHPSIDMLSIRPIDAEYNRATDEIIMVSDSPNQLVSYDPITKTSVTVGLPIVPSSVSISPDGNYAAVGHNAWVSYIDLTTDTLVKSIATTANVLDVVLAGNGYIYAFPAEDQWVGIHSLNITSETETIDDDWAIRAGTLAKLHPAGDYIYGADNGLSPSDLEKYDIASGTASYLYDSPYHGDYNVCGNLWFSEDGARIFTACGNAFRTSTTQGSDMTYNGSLSEQDTVATLDHSIAANEIAAIAKPSRYYRGENDNQGIELFIYDYDFLAFQEKIDLPWMVLGNSGYQGYGRFVFYHSSGENLFVLLQADSESGALNDFGVVTYER